MRMLSEIEAVEIVAHVKDTTVFGVALGDSQTEHLAIEPAGFSSSLTRRDVSQLPQSHHAHLYARPAAASTPLRGFTSPGYVLH